MFLYIFLYINCNLSSLLIHFILLGFFVMSVFFQLIGEKSLKLYLLTFRNLKVHERGFAKVTFFNCAVKNG